MNPDVAKSPGTRQKTAYYFWMKRLTDDTRAIHISCGPEFVPMLQKVLALVKKRSLISTSG
jgi:hypothetical protein